MIKSKVNDNYCNDCKILSCRFLYNNIIIYYYLYYSYNSKTVLFISC